MWNLHFEGSAFEVSYADLPASAYGVCCWSWRPEVERGVERLNNLGVVARIVKGRRCSACGSTISATNSRLFGAAAPSDGGSFGCRTIVSSDAYSVTYCDGAPVETEELIHELDGRRVTPGNILFGA